jgi:hypothetical protein
MKLKGVEKYWTTHIVIFDNSMLTLQNVFGLQYSKACSTNINGRYKVKLMNLPEEVHAQLFGDDIHA